MIKLCCERSLYMYLVEKCNYSEDTAKLICELWESETELPKMVQRDINAYYRMVYRIYG